jgi:hypothetical protein
MEIEHQFYIKITLIMKIITDTHNADDGTQDITKEIITACKAEFCYCLELLGIAKVNLISADHLYSDLYTVQ